LTASMAFRDPVHKKFFIKTYGCQANFADSAKISGILEVLGFEQIDDPKDYKSEYKFLEKVLSEADVFVVNTCSVRQKSEDKVYGLGKLLAKIEKSHGRKPAVILTGCVTGSVTGERTRYDRKELENRTKWVDIYLPSSEVSSLPQVLSKKFPKLSKGLVSAAAGANPNHGVGDSTAYINISYGCDNFCTYCVVPYARGKEVSRSEKDIIKDVEFALSKGKTHIMLCGQNVNSWGLSVGEKFKLRAGSSAKLPFVRLLKKIHAVEGVEKIEFISSNPFDFTQDLVEIFKLPKISNYLHVAVQSGNNDILKKMNRRHTVEEFVGLVESLRKVRPELEIGTDAIVGFPSETEDQFLDTVNLFERVKFAVAFVSMYSPRKGTKAAELADDVPLRDKKLRHRRLVEAWGVGKS
jgi:tRNA-2-methylthio-N6-dimethylallyladenosine synthase